MTHPDDETVVRVISERDGHPHIYPCDAGVSGFCYLGPNNSGCAIPSYLHSLDALRPVLAKLSDAEWFKLCESLDANNPGNIHSSYHKAHYATMRYLLTLDPPVLARAVAESILACAKKGAS